MWQRLEDVQPSADESYFLVRPRGVYRSTGKPFVPTVVYMSGGRLYRPDGDPKPLEFRLDLSPHDPDAVPGLEWHSLPR